MQNADSLLASGWQVIRHKLPEGNGLEVDAAGNLFTWQRKAGRVWKDWQGEGLDSLDFVGGGTGGVQGLQAPIELICPNRQTCFVLDELAREISVLSPSLKVLRRIRFLNQPIALPNGESAEVWPVAFGVNLVGEMFVLNGLDNKVMKFNAFGRCEQVFGGTDYGEGRLLGPTALYCGLQNYVYIADTQQQAVLAFDNFGTYQFRFPAVLSASTRLQVANNKLFVLSKQSLFAFDLEVNRITWQIQLAPELGIRDLAANHDGLFLYSTQAIWFRPFRQ